MSRDERWSLDRPLGTPSQVTGTAPFAPEHPFPPAAPQVELHRGELPPTCPVIDAQGTKQHLFVVGKTRCLCGEQLIPANWR